MFPARSWYELAEDIRQLFLLFGRCNLAKSLVAQLHFLYWVKVKPHPTPLRQIVISKSVTIGLGSAKPCGNT
jgi:hypothetical protein